MYFAGITEINEQNIFNLPTTLETVSGNFLQEGCRQLGHSWSSTLCCCLLHNDRSHAYDDSAEF